MGTSRSAAEFAGKMRGIARTIPTATKTGVKEASNSAKATIFAEAEKRGVHRNSRIAGGKWNVRYNVKGDVRPTSLIRITGAFHLVESDTHAHDIGAKLLGTRNSLRGKAFDARTRRSMGGSTRGTFGPLIRTTTSRRGTRQRAGKQALTVGGDVRAYVHHPGTTGKGIFRAAKARITRDTPAVIRRQIVIDITGKLNG